MWNAHDPAVANIEEIKKQLDKVPHGTILRLGGMTDCFQECERQYGVTYQTIKELNKRGIGYLIVTKSDLVADDKYTRIMDRDLAHIQITVTCLDDDFYLSKAYEKAPLPSRRIAAILKLQELGFDVAIRLSPLIEEYMDFDKLSDLGIKKGIVEFLRVNHWILKWFDVDRKKFRIKDGGYRHLPIKEKVRIVQKIRNMEISVCEDVSGHFNYWRFGFNPNPEDCCNLRLKK
jgi:DNA repair photolyase